MKRRNFTKRLSLCGVAAFFGAPIASYAREVLATVLERTIYRDELRGRVDELSGLIIRPLLFRFAAEQQLTVSAAEIDEFISAMNVPRTPPSLSTAESTAIREFYKGMVLDWKISRALFLRYGGDVIFQQANPLEPIGAMRKFLEEQELSKAFTIYDPIERDRFYEYYKRTHQSVVPPSQVSYDKPWWRK